MDFTDGQQDNYLQPEGAQAAKPQPPPSEYLQDNGGLGNQGDDDFDDNDELLKGGSKQPLLVKGWVWDIKSFLLSNLNLYYMTMIIFCSITKKYNLVFESITNSICLFLGVSLKSLSLRERNNTRERRRWPRKTLF